MQVALSCWLISPTHSLSSALSKWAEIRLYLRKWTERVGTWRTFLRQLLVLRRTTERVIQFSYLILPRPPSKAYLESFSKSKPKFASLISLANYSAFFMNCFTGRNGFLLLRSRLCSYRSAFTSCFGSDCGGWEWACFSLSSDYWGRLLEEAGMRKASGNLEDAFLAILGLAIWGSCYI